MIRPFLRCISETQSSLPGSNLELHCLICHKPVQLENAKTDERGKAVHEECYALKLESERALS